MSSRLLARSLRLFPRLTTAASPLQGPTPHARLLQGISSRVLWRQVTTSGKTHAMGLNVRSDIYERRQKAMPGAVGAANRVRRLTLLEEDRMVEALWGDGEATRYPYVWLRDNCQCESCFHLFTKARLVLMKDLDVNIKPQKVEVDAEGTQALITWQDGHTSPVGAAWLRARSFTASQHEKRDLMFRRKPILWGAEMQGTMPTFEFDQLLEDDRALYNMLTAMEEYGMTTIKGAPKEEGQVKKLADKISFMRMTPFGFIYTVKAREDPPNLAWTSDPLGLHVDFVYLAHTPGFQILQCIVQAEGEGGESEMVDGFRAAHQMKEEYPFYYKLLSEVPVDFTDVGSDIYPYHYLARHTTLTHNVDGELEAVKYSNQTRDSFLRVPLELVTPFYKALRLFNDYLYRPENTISFRLHPGDIVCFHNYRVLHGRTGFTLTPGSPIRHLEGCYLDWDDVHSRRRLLLQDLGLNH